MLVRVGLGPRNVEIIISFHSSSSLNFCMFEMSLSILSMWCGCSIIIVVKACGSLDGWMDKLTSFSKKLSGKLKIKLTTFEYKFNLSNYYFVCCVNLHKFQRDWKKVME